MSIRSPAAARADADYLSSMRFFSAAAAALIAASLPLSALAADTGDAAQGNEKAQSTAESKSGTKTGDNSKDNTGGKPGDKTDDLWTRKNLLGDIGGIRPALQQHGMTLAIVDTDEILGNVTGGR